ncbi:MAG: hypothetical protein JWL81_2723 [Verrucomicrobiales bacterium]|nr:hypothetical protein [Verrucomicrobiales bacterium]
MGSMENIRPGVENEVGRLWNQGSGTAVRSLPVRNALTRIETTEGTKFLQQRRNCGRRYPRHSRHKWLERRIHPPPMKAQTLFIAAVAVPSSLLAGEYTQTTQSAPPPISPGYSLYNAGEWQIDLFGAYAEADSGNRRLIGEDVFGGGLGFNYFFTRNVGIGAEGTLFDTPGDMLGSANVNLTLRFPIGETGLAPYIFGGAGVVFNADDLDSDDFSDARDRFEDDDEPGKGDDVIFIGHAGAGLEFRFSPHVSIFGDARYTWTESDNSDFGQARAGLRFTF